MSFHRTYASSPVLAMQPQGVHQMTFGNPFHPYHSSPFGNHSVSLPPQLVRTSSVAGRKRSRDEAAVNLDSPEKIVEPPSKESEEEWVYGPGMTLIKKTSGYVADASSQSGTWVEDKKAKEDAVKAEAALLAQQQMSQERPSLRSHKSQRLEMPSLHANDRTSSRRSSPSREATDPLSASSDSVSQPLVDDFTLKLGVGWSQVSNDEHIQAAARGWARFIENHYPVTNAKIRLESRGLQSYLVESNEGFFLFDENLRHGRLVGKTAERTLSNLQTSPPVFDGLETLSAADMSRPAESPAASAVEMDMS